MPAMKDLNADVDPGGLLEFSVVFTDRSLNHMSQAFQGVMRDLHKGLIGVYNAADVAIVPGGGSIAMEAVARQFATDRRVLVVRNGWFSFRWSQIFAAGNLPSRETVLKATQINGEAQSPFAPPPVEEVVAAIHRDKPHAVFAPHVETSAGIILPDAYIKAIADAVHDVGGILVLDCVASGCVWVDMAATGVDVLISAPQKGWSASPSAGLVMLSERGVEELGQTKSNSFALDLAKWHQIMGAYVNGGHAYHATMPTDSLRSFRDTLIETGDFGFAAAKSAQFELGGQVRTLLSDFGHKSVAAPGFEAPGVVVSFTNDPAIKSGAKFAAVGTQIAAGVPLEIGEPDDYASFRIGLFGIDKLKDIPTTVGNLRHALERVAQHP